MTPESQGWCSECQVRHDHSSHSLHPAVPPHPTDPASAVLNQIVVVQQQAIQVSRCVLKPSTWQHSCYIAKCCSKMCCDCCDSKVPGCVEAHVALHVWANTWCAQAGSLQGC